MASERTASELGWKVLRTRRADLLKAGECVASTGAWLRVGVW